MDLMVMDGIKNSTMQLSKKLEKQMLEPKTSREELRVLIMVQLSLYGAVRYMMQAMGVKVNNETSGEDRR